MNLLEPIPVCGAHGVLLNEVIHCTVRTDIEHSLHIGKSYLRGNIVTWPATLGATPEREGER